MPAEYVNITRGEMEDFLLPMGFRPLPLDGTKELVYGKRVDSDAHKLSLRVYTGINPDGNSRVVGGDAIRCNIFWRTENGELRRVATSKRVHRVKGWRENLLDRLTNLKVERICTLCGSPMVLRRGKSKGKPYEFYGCASYPVCQKTERKES